MVMFGGMDCYYCGRIKPLEDLRRIEVWEESTKSGGSLTVRGSNYGYNNLFHKGKGSRRGGGVSYNFGRVNYKKIKAFACNECLEKQAKRQAILAEQAIRFWSWVIGILAVLIVWAIIF